MFGDQVISSKINTIKRITQAQHKDHIVKRKKKILIVVDHRARDLKGLANLAHKLITVNGHLPIITQTRNEIRNLILHRPHLILMSHVLFPRHLELVDIAESVGTRIGLLATEGSNDPKTNAVNLSLDELKDRVDLILTWGKVNEDYLKKQRIFGKATINTCGCPRFDFYSNPGLYENVDREEFCNRNGIDPTKPIVFWATGTVHANQESMLDEVWEKRLKGRYHSYQYYLDRYRDNTQVMNYSVDLIENLSKDFSDEINLVVKVHPQEKITNYDRLRAKCPSILFVPQSDPFENYVHHIDILLHFRCSTSFERWLVEIKSPTIHMTHKNIVQKNDRDHVYKGSDVVEDYDSLYRLVAGYLNGKKVSEAQILFRRNFITDYLHSGDSKRAEHCAQLINEYLENVEREYKLHQAVLWRGPKVIAAHVIKTNGGKKIWKEDHMNFFDKTMFSAIMERLNKAYQTCVKESDYVLDV